MRQTLRYALKAAPAAPLLVGLLIGLSGAAASATPDSAQGLGDLSARLQTEQQQSAQLAGVLAADTAQVKAIEVADIFGPSEEEKAAAAAAAQRENTQDSNIAALNQRAGEIEESIRRLTGQIELLNHRLDETDQKIERLRKEFDYKLCSVTAQQLGAAPGSPAAVPCNGDAPAASLAPAPAATPDLPPQQPTGVTRLAPPPGVLGTLPQSDAANLPQPAPDVAAMPPANEVAGVDTHAPFEAAMQMLKAQQFDAARGAFQNFADTYPKDPKTSQALYWVGDIAFVQKDYQAAALAFTQELKRFPKSDWAPESMLKLGQSLIAMNQKDQGCIALHALPGRYPAASKTVLAQAEALRKAGGCKH